MNDYAMYYNNYLHLKQVLESQHPKSFEPPNTPAHDEMLFIIIHQATELWFKQILFELDYVLGVFNQPTINDNSEDLNLVRHRLNRIKAINELLIQQVGLLGTMTPLDFLAFRNLLTPASGFQSLQFRLIEAKLGLKMDSRHQKDYYKRTNEGGFSQQHFEQIEIAENETPLLKLVNRWLERMPFFDAAYWPQSAPTEGNALIHQHPFWAIYTQLYANNLIPGEKGRLDAFCYVFFDQRNAAVPADQLSNLRHDLSAAAMRSALFVMLYRDFPMFQTTFQILDSLIEIDHLMSNWRHKHFIMVRRMIGMRVGTGNTSGAGYLEGAMQQHFVFKDLAALSTYLIERQKLPQLPQALVQRLTFY